MTGTLICIFSLLFWTQIKAAEVLSVKGQKVQIKLQADDFLEAQEKYVLINEQKKRVGLVTIVSVGETEGQTLLIKGSTKPGYKLQLWTPPAASGSRKKSQNQNYLGISIDVMMNQLSLTFGSTTIAMKGQSFGLALAYQQGLAAEIKMRYALGYRSFAVKASDPLCAQNSCEISVAYITAGARLDYFLNDAFFVGGGLEYLSPSSKSSSVLNTDQIQSNSVATVAVGGVFNSQIPIALTYNHFLQNKDAASSYLAVQLGYLLSF